VLLIATPVFLFTSRPTDCQAIEIAFKNSAAGDGFSSFTEFVANKIVVRTHIVGLGWRQTVVYPNPRLTQVFKKPTATEIAVDQSLFINSEVYYSLNIPLNELDTKVARKYACNP